MSWLSGLFLLLALLGTPLFVIIAGGALLGFWQAEIDLQIVTIEIFRMAEMPILVAIPLFTFAGYLLSESEAPQRLVRLTQTWIGWLPGGLPIVSLVTCALFTAFTGASGVTIVALGAILAPALMQAGYPERFNLGLITSSGSLGLLFAPSVPLILYGVVAQQIGVGTPVSIDDLFIAGITPGLLMILVLSIWSARQGALRAQTRQPFELAPALAALRESWLELPLPVIVLGGIYSGLLVVSEAAAVTAIYVLIVQVLIRREISISQTIGIARDSMVLVGAILVILGVSLASTNYVIDAELPTALFEWINERISSRTSFLLLLIGFLLLLGMLLDVFSAIVIMIPIILPIGVGYGVDPVHLGILFLAAMQIGYFTPPVGMNLFIASFRFNKPVMTLYRATLPFFFLLLGCVLLIGLYSPLSLWLLDR
ncbi:MAG: TRAP transporter large permease subunit [Pseudomonadota bacterium]